MKTGSGEIVASFDDGDAGKTFHIRLVAHDAGGASVTVRTITFSVIKPPGFRITTFERRDNSGYPALSIGENSDDGTIGSYNNTMPAASYNRNQSFNAYAGEDVFVLNGIKPSTIVLLNRSLENDKKSLEEFKTSITYTMLVTVTTNASDDAEVSKNNAHVGIPEFLIDPKTGFVRGQPIREGKYNLTFYAVDPVHDSKAYLETIILNVVQLDTENPDNGPNGQGCLNDGVRNDGVKYDEKFTCDCKDAYEGANCNKNVEKERIAAILGTILAVVVGILAVVRIRARRLLMRAHSFELTLEEMRAKGEIAEEQLAAAKANAAAAGANTPRSAMLHHTPREIKRSNLTMLSKIGAGAFGDVWRGILDEARSGDGVPGYEVAIKTCQESGGEGEADLLKEATVMAMVPPHDNIVPLIGVVTRGLPLYLVVPICSHGSMLSFLRDRTASGAGLQLTTTDKIMMALDVAKGMAHLASCSFVHRDLAARNVLVDSVYRCRVADFGLSRATATHKRSDGDGDGSNGATVVEEEQYYRSERGQFPVRWTAPEAMETHKFSILTDIWYGCGAIPPAFS